jgi:hypothetical protein
VREQIFKAIDPLLRTSDIAAKKGLEPLVDRIARGLETNDPLVTASFGQFWHRDMSSPFAKLAPTEVVREGVPPLAVPGAELAGQLTQFKEIFRDSSDWEGQTQRFLEQNPGLDLQKTIYDWAINQPDKSIQRVVDSALSFDRLRQTYRNLIKDAPIKYSDGYETDNAPYQLMERARRDDISMVQVHETMQNVVQLLEIANRYPGLKVANDFRMAGLQALRQAADPLIITQGAHPTCALASLETSLYKNNPAQATRLVNEVLRTGKFITTDGTEIKIDPLSLRPEDRSLAANKTKFHDPNEIFGYRSYASQVFQNTVANIYWQRQTETPYLRFLAKPAHETVPKGSMRYEMLDVTDSAGNTELKDQLVDYHTGQRRVLAGGPSIYTLHELEDMGRQIGGQQTVPTIIADGSPVLASSAAFKAYMQSLQPPNFPVIISIDAGAMMKAAPGKIVLNHAVSILLNPDGNVQIHNTWRPFSDVHQPGKWIPNSLSQQRLLQIMGVS